MGSYTMAVEEGGGKGSVLCKHYLALARKRGGKTTDDCDEKELDLRNTPLPKTLTNQNTVGS